MREEPGRTIVYAVHKDGVAYIAPPAPAAVYQCSLTPDPLVNLGAIGANTNWLLVADSFVPKQCKMPTLVVSSPGQFQAEDSELMKAYHPCRLYMPVPTEEELWALYRTSFADRSADGVNRRLQVWGPVPRTVLQVVDDDAQRAYWIRVREALPKQLVTTTQYTSLGFHLGDESNPLHRVVLDHCAGADPTRLAEADIRNPAYYYRGKPDVASDLLVHYIAQVTLAKATFDAAFFVDGSAGIGIYGAARGHFFERLMGEVLAAGGSFPCRELVKRGATSAGAASAAAAATGGAGTDTRYAAPTTFTFAKPKQVGRWSTPRELAILARKKQHTLLLPTHGNAAGLDAVIVDAEGHFALVDFTVGSTHGIHVDGMAEAVKALGWTPSGWPARAGDAARHTEIRYYWALPQNRYKTGWMAERHEKQGSKTTPLADEAWPHVRQFAFCVEYTTEFLARAKSLAETLPELDIEKVLVA